MNEGTLGSEPATRDQRAVQCRRVNRLSSVRERDCERRKHTADRADRVLGRSPRIEPQALPSVIRLLVVGHRYLAHIRVRLRLPLHEAPDPVQRIPRHVPRQEVVPRARRAATERPPDAQRRLVRIVRLARRPRGVAP